LRAADRGKNSDPYAVFRLNGERKAKSKTIKKTLHPEWNEDLGEHPVGSRVAAEAIIEVFDWDQVGTADPLGEARLDLAALEPFDRSEVTLPLTGKGAGDHTPTVTVRMVFKPDFVTHRERKGTSIARTMTSGIGGVAKVGGAGVKGVGQAGMFVGKTAFGVPKGAFNLATGRNHRKSVPGVPDEENLADLSSGAPPLPAMPAFNADGLPIVPSSASTMPISPASQHFQQSSGGMAPSLGDESFASNGADSPQGKRKSRIHNPFKKHS
jgi:C2 domain